MKINFLVTALSEYFEANEEDPKDPKASWTPKEPKVKTHESVSLQVIPTDGVRVISHFQLEVTKPKDWGFFKEGKEYQLEITPT